MPISRNQTLVLFFIILCTIYIININKLKSTDSIHSSARTSVSSFSSQIIIYNRVPKTGSTTLTNAIAYDLCRLNGFHTLHLNVSRNRHQLTLSDQSRLISNVTEWRQRLPAFYHGHVAFIDFTRFGKANPIYINMIREPLERMLSHYYFLRYGDNYRIGLKRSRAGNNETFDECLLKKGKDCDMKQMWLQVAYFCGQQAFCSMVFREAGNAEALEMAKRNLLEHYLIVGVSEQMRQFIAVLENVLPKFFAGALTHFDSLTDHRAHLRSTKKKIAPNRTSLEIVQASEVYKMEKAFYDFAKANFEAQFERMLAKDCRDSKAFCFLPQQFHYEKIKPSENS